mgnify:CR=1 FL=1
MERQLTPDASTVCHTLIGVTEESLERARVRPVVYDRTIISKKPRDIQGQRRTFAALRNDHDVSRAFG